MKTFNLIGEVTVSIYTEVEAETLDEAIKMALDRDVQPSQFDDNNAKRDSWIAEEYDGMPTNIMEA